MKEGQANSTGFEVSGDGIIVYSKNYRRNKLELRLPLIVWIVFLIFYAFLVAGHFLITKEREITIDFFSVIVLSLFMINILGLINDFVEFFGGTSKCLQWHACEHKVIRLLDKNLPLTLENLKKMKKEHLWCGTLIRMLILVTMPVYYFFGFNIHQFKTFKIFIDRFFNGSVTTILYFCIVVLIVFLLCQLASWLFQHFINTIEPTEEQLKEGLRVAEKFKFKLEEQNKTHPNEY